MGRGEASHKKLILKSVIVVFFSLVFSFMISTVMDRNWYLDLIWFLQKPVDAVKGVGYYAYCRIGNIDSMRIYRIIFLMPVFLFIGLHFIISPKVIWANMYRYRWLVGLAVLVYFVALRFHGDSLAMYDVFGLQKEQGDALRLPVFGMPRAIRSDEYIVDNARRLFLYQIDKPFGDFSILTYVLMPTNIIGIVIYKVLGAAFLYAFDWYALRVLGFLISLEFFLLLTGRKRGISFACTCMLQLSGFFMWWGYPAHFVWSEAAILCFWYFFEKEKTWQKFLFLVGTGLSAVNFVRSFYPAWQVPLAFISLLLVVWVIVANRKNISNLKKIHVAMLIGAALFAAVFLLLYLRQSKEYIDTITNTVYPGRRYSNGGRGVRELFRYIINTFFAFKEIPNNSEKAAVISFFPIPVIMAILVMIRKKKKDGLLIGMLGLLAFFLWYIIFGMPGWVAKFSLMRFSTTGRCVDVAGYLTLLIFARCYGVGSDAGSITEENTAESTGKDNPAGVITGADASRENTEKLPGRVRFVNAIKSLWGPSGIVLLVSLVAAFYLSLYARALGGGNYLQIGEYAVVLPLFFGTMYWLLLLPEKEKRTRVIVVLLSLYSLFVGAYARPVSVGLSSVYEKPVAKKIMELNEAETGKWISCHSWYLQSFTTLCGAETMNYVNTIPNLELWHKMDPKRQYEEVYNRYAHVTVDLLTEGETSFSLNVVDNFTIHIAPQDLSKMEIDYVIAEEELELDNPYYTLEKVYDEYKVRIYRVHYTDR